MKTAVIQNSLSLSLLCYFAYFSRVPYKDSQSASTPAQIISHLTLKFKPYYHTDPKAKGTGFDLK